jgi:predicted porin
MKKNILAIAIATAVAAPVAMADAPKVYGQFNLAIDMMSEAGTDNVVHRNSRLGVKGGEDLGNGMKAVYQMEGTIQMGDFVADRNTFAGLAGGFGTVVMGRHDTPLRMIQPSDGFADSAAAGNNTSSFTGGNGHPITGGSGEDRLSNVLAYISPSFNGIQFAAATSTQVTSDLMSVNSFSIAYGSKSKGIYAAAAMTDVDGSRSNTRVTVQYNEAGLVGSVMYTTVKDQSTTLDGNSIVAGVAYKMGALTPRAKVAMVSYDDKVANEDSAMNMAFGVDYALSKATKAYVEIAMIDENNRGSVKDETVTSVGLFHKF